jgi:hypothetical protein
MKKICVMLAIALIVSGSVWGQEFDAVQTMSVEKAYSAGLFDSDVDNFIDPSFFDGQIGNFVFMGGFHNGYNGPSFNTYNYNGAWGDYDNDATTPDTWGWDVNPPTADTISVGYAKTLGTDKYLALYYGGSFVNALGYKRAGDKDDATRPNADRATADAVWRNSLAVLFGLNNMGFRLDFIMNNTDETTTRSGGKVVDQDITNAPSVALSWGLNTGKLAPWVKLGIEFPDTYVRSSTDADGGIDKTATGTTGGYFLFNAGVWYELDETSSVSADLTFGGEFADSFKGDSEQFSRLPGYDNTTFPGNDDPYTAGGIFDLGLDVDYTKALTFGEYTTVKIKPNLGVMFASVSGDDSRADDKVPSFTTFSVGAGIDIGGEYRYDKIALYTGFGLRFFEWTTYGWMGGKEKDGDTWWEFKGFAWDADKFGPSSTNGNLRFGMTFTPIEGLVFGAGVKVPVLNPVSMQIGTTYPTSGNTTNYRTSGSDFWDGTTLSVTVSYKFASKPKEPKEDAE